MTTKYFRGLKIDKRIVALSTNNQSLKKYFYNYKPLVQPFVKIIQINIKKNTKSLSITKNQVKIVLPKTERSNKINYFVKLYSQFFIVHDKILILHASGYVKGKRAYLFCGPSGAGKSTKIKKVKKKYILGDDSVIIKIKGRQILVSSSPFEGNINSKLTNIPLAKIYFLKKSKFNCVEKLDYQSKIELLFMSTVYFQYFLIGDKNISSSKNLFDYKSKNKFALLGKQILKLTLQISLLADIMILKSKKSLNAYKQMN